MDSFKKKFRFVKSIYDYFFRRCLLFKRFVYFVNTHFPNNTITKFFKFIICILFAPIWLVAAAFNKNPIILRKIEISITSRCTLKCRDCSNLMQVYRSMDRTYELEFDSFVSDMNKLFTLVDFIETIDIIGGEAFIGGYLPNILRMLIKSKKIGLVEIITNGTVVPNDEILRIIKNKKVHIHISEYSRELAPNSVELKKALAANGVNTLILHPVWYDRFGEEGLRPRNRSASELADNFANCLRCIEFMDGKLHFCPVSSHGMYLGLIPAGENDYVDVRNANDESNRRKMMNFIKPPRGFYVRACDHCDAGMPGKKRIPAAVQGNWADGKNDSSSFTMISP